jgi:hypothetical protein
VSDRLARCAKRADLVAPLVSGLARRRHGRVLHQVDADDHVAGSDEGIDFAVGVRVDLLWAAVLGRHSQAVALAGPLRGGRVVLARFDDVGGGAQGEQGEGGGEDHGGMHFDWFVGLLVGCINDYVAEMTSKDSRKDSKEMVVLVGCVCWMGMGCVSAARYHDILIPILLIPWLT